MVAPPDMRLAVSDASPSFPFGSAADPLLIQMLNATNGEFGSGSAMVLAALCGTGRPAPAGSAPANAMASTTDDNRLTTND